MSMGDALDRLKGKTVTIDRGQWNAARMACGIGLSALYSSDYGDYCCWGFVGKELDIPDEKLEGEGYLSDVLNIWQGTRVSLDELKLDGVTRNALKGKWDDHTKAEYFITEVQDHPNLSPVIKERFVKAVFKQVYDINIEFVGEHPHG